MILPDWFWHRFGRKLMIGFDPGHVNPTSYDLTLGTDVALQVYQGVELRDERREIQGDRLWPEDCVPLPSFPNVFRPGDSVLAHTDEYLKLPRWLKLQGHLKSSLAREGLNHRTALLIDPGFEGQITLELEFSQTGQLVPFTPIIQVEAQLVFPRRHYGQMAKSHYQMQGGVTANRNRRIAFQRVDLNEEEESELQEIQELLAIS